MGKLIDKYPNLAKQWHPTKNDDLTPNVEFSFRKKKFGGNATLLMITYGSQQ